MTERRFTDQDVALILRRAVDLDRESGRESRGRGLSLEDLREIAVEVGVDPAMVSRAAEELGTRSVGRSLSLMGDPVVRRGVRAVPGTADEETLRELMRIVDREMPAQGTVTEALGTVRWNSGGRFLSRQVSIEPTVKETLIRVEERFEQRARTLVHAIPSSYAGFLGFIVGLEQLGGRAPGIALGLFSAAAAFAIAGQVWNRVSRNSRARVEALADELSSEASKRLPGPSEEAPKLPDSSEK